MVHAAQTWHYFGTALVKIQVTRLAFEALMEQTVEKRATVVAKGGRCVAVKHELVLIEGSVRVGALVRARAHERDELVATFVDRE